MTGNGNGQVEGELGDSSPSGQSLDRAVECRLARLGRRPLRSFSLCLGALAAVALLATGEPRASGLRERLASVPATFPGRNGLLVYEAEAGLHLAGPAGGRGRSLPGLDGAQAAWSPSGRQLVFSASRNDGNELYVARADGSGVRRLTSLPPLSERYPSSDDFSPSWFPSGRRILFEREIADELGDNGVNADLFTVSDKGGAPVTLTRWPNLLELDPAVSPDGRMIVFSLAQLGRPKREIADGLFLLRSDGRGLRRLTTSPRFTLDASPTWSPDGRRIAFRRERDMEDGSNRAYQEIHVINRDRSGLRRLTVGTQAYSPVWSPDGRFITYCTFPGGPDQPPSQILVPISGEPARTLPLEPPGCVTDWQAVGRSVR